MIQFELRGTINNGYVKIPATETEPAKLKFTITLIVGVVGNTYPSFTNQEQIIYVVCNMSDSGTDYEEQIATESIAAVQTYFPTIN